MMFTDFQNIFLLILFFNEMQRKTFFKGEVFDLMNSKYLLLSNRSLIEMSRRTCFT